MESKVKNKKSSALQAIETFNPFRSPLRIPKTLQNDNDSSPAWESLYKNSSNFLIGPFITFLMLLVVELVAHFIIKLPNPGAIFVTAVVFAAFSGGLYAGLMSSLIVIIYSMYYFSSPTIPFYNSPDELQRVLTVAFTAPIVAFMVGVLKDRAQLLIHEQQARNRAEATAEMVRRLQAVIDPTIAHFTVENLRRILLLRIKTLFNVDTAQIFIREKNILVLKAARGLEESFKHGARIPIGRGFAGKIAEKRKPIMIENISKTEIKLLNPLLREKRLKSLLGVPLLIEGKVIGVLHIGSTVQRRFTEGEAELLQLIADRVALAVDRAYQYQKAEDAIRARDEFLSIASHELKNPLTTMLLQLQDVLQSIKRETVATFSFEKMVSRIESAEQQSRRLAKLINDLLNVSFITAGRLELDREIVDLGAIVGNVVGRFEKNLEESNSKISIEAQEEVKGLFDKVRIEQVITNLLSNAIKYGDGKPIQIEIGKTENYAYIHIKDNGIGIENSKIQKIFKRFERGVSRREYKGLGVGLYISEKIVEEHGGRMKVKSKLNEGSVFTIELPLNGK